MGQVQNLFRSTVLDSFVHSFLWTKNLDDKALCSTEQLYDICVK